MMGRVDWCGVLTMKNEKSRQQQHECTHFLSVFHAKNAFIGSSYDVNQKMWVVCRKNIIFIVQNKLVLVFVAVFFSALS